jgi:hypothetical protein
MIRELFNRIGGRMVPMRREKRVCSRIKKKKTPKALPGLGV